MTNLDFQKPNFITADIAQQIKQKYTTPVYVYDEQVLSDTADDFLGFPNAFGHDVRYAMKANPNVNILKLFNKKGLKIDAASEYEVKRAISAGFDGKDIHISAQEFPVDMQFLLDNNVEFIATSLDQITRYGELNSGGNIGIRINPGSWSGAFKAISTGGTTSGFGIWHEYIADIKQICKKYNLTVTKIHIHIGSENTPESWVKSATTGLDFVRQFPDAHTLDMGGWFKKAIMPYEQSADLQGIWKAVAEKFEEFKAETGREIHLEVEPGKFMVINSCSVICEVVDIVNTWEDGYEFIRVNSWMTEMPRVPMYGVQEPIYILNNSDSKTDYVVIGHCCESGDLLTCKLYEQEEIETRSLNTAQVWDLMVIDGVGAYNASMSMKNYNSFPEAWELMLRKDGSIVEIRARQTLEEIYKNEISVI